MVLYSALAELEQFHKMGIPFTPLAENDTVASWKLQNRPLALITLAHSKKWTNGSALRRVVATTSAACGGPMDSFAGVAGLSGSLG